MESLNKIIELSWRWLDACFTPNKWHLNYREKQLYMQPTSSIKYLVQGMTPYEKWYGNKPSM
jgi:hypothetical protein